MNELPNSPQGLLNLMPSTMDQINSFSSGIIRAVKEGNVNPLDVMLQMKAMEKSFENIKNQIKENVNREADKYPGVTFNYRGVELVKGDVKTEYDYTVCNDTVWERRNTDAESAKRLLDERQSFLKSLKEPITTVDEMTGEIVTIRPPLKKSTPGVKFYIR